MTVNRIATPALSTVGPAPGSVTATLDRLADEAWWATIRDLPSVGATLPSQIVCVGHFLAWLDDQHLRITDCTDEHLTAYDRAVERFRPREAYRRSARRFVELAAVWQACQLRGLSVQLDTASTHRVVAL